MTKTFLLVIALSLILTGCSAQRGSARAAQQRQRARKAAADRRFSTL